MNIIRKDGTIEVYPIDPSNKESKWVFARDTVESIKTELSAEYNLKKNTWDVIRKKSVFRYKSLWEDKRYSANSWGSVVLNNILPNSPFTYPKSIFTLRDCIDAGLNNSIEGIVLDYFAGSGTTGHAVINLNREDGGQRKFILIEMAQYFDTVLLPRIKKITFTPEWKEGKPKRLATKEEAGRSPRIVKVIRLESYEDTLNNIAFEADASQRAMEFEDYLLQYMLKWETRKSETLLNVEKLTRPFSYNLNVHRDGETKTRAVDLPETFNYLLGLSVQKRQVLNDGGKHYLSYLGTTREGRTVAVIWRDTEGWKEKDYKHDKEFVAGGGINMPRPRQQPAGHSAAPGIAQYTKLENRLVLLSWLNDLLGYKRNKDLLADTKSAAEGFDASGSSFLIHHLFARGSRVKIPIEDLERYDENIRLHLASINRGRTEPITLRYFQYLATLYTEIVLDRYFNHCTQLLADLNAYVHERNIAKFPGEAPDEVFAESDLAKLAFWMATGSGKTLLLHLNYHQFIHYNKEALDNILLITPNEGLSEQHTAELAASGIPVRRFDPNHSGLFTNKGNTVQVIEITKLVEEKKGGGVSVSVEAFEGRNLIFVDEGHKGSGGEAWRGYRDALGVVGFTFEYSATFGQALSAVRNDPLTIEYGKAIVFDYSYRYFYGDGYGKDFRILNLKEDTRNDQAEILLLGNLLSFYEQQHVFQEHAGQLRPYNIEKPLWVFVGSTVNAVYSENKEKRSDVLTVARFLHHVLENRRGWVVKGIEKLLAGKSGLTTQGTERMDIFAGRYEALRETGLTPQALYADILKRIFCADAGGGLHVCDIRGSAGELALKVAGAEKYFGLIYIGDTSEFKKLVETDGAGIVLEEDAISSSLFEDINRPDSHVHILIGAKKFMEGWNSWRVSNMGLLNIGRQEGSQI
ncbi:MAG: DNA methyltransferase, partial [Lentisphaerae bacterium]|nr:DNA methyltransferase [Lentisphaerota bacterium]